MVDMKYGLLIVWAAFAFLTLCGGQSQKIGQRQQITVMVGDDAILPCHLEPPVDAVSMTIEWGRPDLDPRFVIVWHDGQELLADQNKVYEGRASLSINKLKLGDLSVKLSKVKISDNGTYRCFIPKINKEYFVELLVGAASSPGISLAGIHKVNSGVMLDCRSKGWYPEPEVFWLDGEGNLLSAGPTETVRGPDDLYTVRRRLTVRKSDRFTCRVQQKNINQTRETHFYVPDDFFMAPSSCTSCTAVSVFFAFMFILTVILLVWTLRKNEWKMTPCLNKKKEKDGEKKITTSEMIEAGGSGEPLMTDRTKMEDLEKMRPKLNEELQQKEEEQKYIIQVIETLKELEKQLKEQKEKLTDKISAAEKQVEENELNLKSVDKEVSDRGGDKTGKAQGYTKLREIMMMTNWSLNTIKKEHQQLQLNTEKLLQRTMDDIKTIEDRKNKVENDMQQIRKQIEETERGHPEKTNPLTSGQFTQSLH